MELGGWAFQPFGNFFKSIAIIIFPSQLTRNIRNLSRSVTGWVCTRISSAASETCSLQYTIRTPVEFHRPSKMRAPSPEKADLACFSLTMRQPTTLAIRNKHRTQFGLTDSQLRVLRSPSWQNPAALRHRARAVYGSTTLAR